MASLLTKKNWRGKGGKNASLDTEKIDDNIFHDTVSLWKVFCYTFESLFCLESFHFFCNMAIKLKACCKRFFSKRKGSYWTKTLHQLNHLNNLPCHRVQKTIGQKELLENAPLKDPLSIYHPRGQCSPRKCRQISPKNEQNLHKNRQKINNFPEKCCLFGDKKIFFVVW